jgi:hypothetical protein
MNKESSLTAPHDRNRDDKWKPDSGLPTLTKEEGDNAVSDLIVKVPYPQIDRFYVDPVLNMQYLSLISFVPSKGSRPDEAGIYGCFASEMEADQRADYIVRNVDSFHKIYYPRVGHPFPITTESKFSAVHNEIDIRKTVASEFSNDIKTQKDTDQQHIKEIQEREKLLKEDVSKEFVDPYDEYITLKVKKAQLSGGDLEHIKKMDEIKIILKEARQQLVLLDESHPTFKDQYYQKYIDARREAGLALSPDDGDSFMRFLVEDAILPGIDS